MSHYQQFLASARSQMNLFLDRTEEQALLDAAQLIWEAQGRGNRVHITGIGKPGHLAGYIASLMSSDHRLPAA